jgi:hypothetical protein
MYEREYDALPRLFEWEGTRMEMSMTKKTLDTWGGVGSILCGLVCVWFSMSHNQHESMWKVWVGFSVLLVLNGLAMILYAQRGKRSLGMPVHQGH